MSLDTLNRIANDALAKERKADTLRRSRSHLKHYHSQTIDSFLNDLAINPIRNGHPEPAVAAIRKALEEAQSDLIQLAVIRLAAEEGAVRREAKRLRGMVDAAIVKTSDENATDGTT